MEFHYTEEMMEKYIDFRIDGALLAGSADKGGNINFVFPIIFMPLNFIL